MDSDPLSYDELLMEIERLLGKPFRSDRAFDGSTVFVGGEPEEVVVRVTQSLVEISEYRMGWDGPHTPVVMPETLAALHWQHLSAIDLSMILRELIEVARTSRGEQFIKCKYCGRELGPEHMHGDVCHGCAEKHEGIVH